MDDKELRFELKALQNEIDDLNDQIETIFCMLQEMTDEITYQNMLARHAVRKARHANSKANFNNYK